LRNFAQVHRKARRGATAAISLADLVVQKVGERLELAIQDNGYGFQPDEVRKGFGLSTMRERAELSGGTFAIQSAEGKGTVIRASWPLGL
jgi:signal transduction histidine kinase